MFTRRSFLKQNALVAADMWTRASFVITQARSQASSPILRNRLRKAAACGSTG
jgi:hypothetical protein